MTNDSVTIAMMNGLGLRNLATYDSDLLRIPELEIYRPGDIRIRP
jgi:predicted nucleic acid-binding protein